VNLADYEAEKFELADILRSVPGAEDSSSPGALRESVHDLFARLAEDRFNLVVAGRFSRGKTTLMNALLGMDRLPTGVLPLTSVITSVAYGSRERVQIQFEGGGIGFEIPMEQLPEYVTENGNPGNVRRIRAARVELPAELLRRGFYFVDTPGLGSAIKENSRTTEAFLPQADAVILVSGYDGPLTDDEVRVARSIAAAGHPLFFVLNKQDLAVPPVQREVEEFSRSQFASFMGTAAPQVFSVSALDALTARLKRDALGYATSGVGQLERKLTQFLVEEKHRVLLRSLAERVRSVLESTDPQHHEDRLHDRLAQLTRRLSGDGGSEVRPAAAAAKSIGDVGLAVTAEAPRIEPCPVCARLRQALFDFLCHYQFEVSRRSSEREKLAASGGLCARHLWHYAAIASDRGICVALPPLVERMAEALRQMAAGREIGEVAPIQSHSAGPKRASERTLSMCIACVTQDEAETAAIDEVVRRCSSASAPGSLPSICLPHLRAMTQRAIEQKIVQALAGRQAGALARLIEDMHRFVLKRDGARSGLATEEEVEAGRRVIAFLAGDRLRAG